MGSLPRCCYRTYNRPMNYTSITTSRFIAVSNYVILQLGIVGLGCEVLVGIWEDCGGRDGDGVYRVEGIWTIEWLVVVVVVDCVILWVLRFGF